jgi:cytosine/adenosine deaminase-related metal-dependent hydrolase
MSRGKSQGGLPPDDVCQTPDEILKDSVRVVDAWHDPSPFAMTRIALAPCSPFSVTPELMKETAHLARERGLRLHTHLAETLDENDYCLQVYGKRPVALMEEYEWLGPDVWFAHCVHLNDAEIDQFAATGTSVAHCPSSNMRLASGIAPVPKMLARGVNVGLAVDGSSSNDSSDMLGELNKALLLHRTLGGPDATTVDSVLRMATRGGARALGRDDVCGQIAPGFAADLALFRIDGLPYIGASVHDPVAALILCGASHIADKVIVNGRVVVDDSRLVFAEEDRIVEEANRIARELVERAAGR